jgi:hypothetical protein
MLIESSDNQLWDYNEAEQYLLRLSDGWLIKDVLPEHLDEIYITEYRVYFLKNNIHHRENGPAIVCSNGYREWWVDGRNIYETNWVEE